MQDESSAISHKVNTFTYLKESSQRFTPFSLKKNFLPNDDYMNGYWCDRAISQRKMLRTDEIICRERARKGCR
jgi:hypothetical protein